MKFQKTIVACKYCGAPFQQLRGDHLYCGQDCRIRARNEKAWVEISPERLCCYNSGVECQPKDRECQTCGWNPDVAAERMRRIKKERKLYDSI